MAIRKKQMKGFGIVVGSVIYPLIFGIMIFMGMTGVWCVIGYCLVNHPMIANGSVAS
jgi:hypothetical protein